MNDGSHDQIGLSKAEKRAFADIEADFLLQEDETNESKDGAEGVKELLRAIIEFQTAATNLLDHAKGKEGYKENGNGTREYSTSVNCSEDGVYARISNEVVETPSGCMYYEERYTTRCGECDRTRWTCANEEASMEIAVGGRRPLERADIGGQDLVREIQKATTIIQNLDDELVLKEDR